MKLKLSVFVGATLLFASPVSARLINDMQTCQAQIEFLIEKVQNSNKDTISSNEDKIVDGLQAYHDYIQSEIVTPGLLQFTGGDASKAKDMQQQVDAYKETLKSQLSQRFSQDALYMDNAMAINTCTQKALPSGEALEALKVSLNTIVDVAKAG